MSTKDLLRIGLHVHTRHSRTSTVSVEDVAGFVRENAFKLATVTDFGTTQGYRELRDLVEDCLVIPGIEVRAQEGDFLVFTTDEEYLAGLPEKVASVSVLRRDAETAVIWAHPFVDQRAKTYEATSLPEVECVVPYIDGIEIFNGTMIDLHKQQLLRTGYFQNLIRVATQMGLTMTGGSDAHEAEMMGHCFTSFSADIADTAAFVDALKCQHAWPGYDHDFFDVAIPLG